MTGESLVCSRGKTAAVYLCSSILLLADENGSVLYDEGTLFKAILQAHRFGRVGHTHCNFHVSGVNVQVLG